ncbi:protein-export chaperone SecB [Peptostreptococcus sp.]|uniref:protein-export chaperone SecB n=1 Tax=Peptostreptococcus sp. TaxID=1262 RepID=UPI001D59E2E3|nr:protein-export chaperone SecB [Peptostreptococcus sp.]MBS5596765.1 protein-export chaperone SecB [Peptostreptococcus sp.]
MESTSILEFKNYTVKSVEFKINEEYEGDSVDIDFNIQAGYKFLNKSINEFSTLLKVIIFEDALNNNYPFTMKLEIEGFFKVNSDDKNIIDDMITKNSISILFPYVRSLVSTYTANSNISTLILPPINVLKMLGER